MLSLIYWRVQFGVKVSLKMTEDAIEQEQSPRTLSSV